MKLPTYADIEACAAHLKAAHDTAYQAGAISPDADDAALAALCAAQEEHEAFWHAIDALHKANWNRKNAVAWAIYQAIESAPCGTSDVDEDRYERRVDRADRALRATQIANEDEYRIATGRGTVDRQF